MYEKMSGKAESASEAHQRRRRLRRACVVLLRLVEAMTVPATTGVALAPSEQVVVLETNLVAVEEQPLQPHLPRAIHMRYLYAEFVCKYLCIYRIYSTIIRSSPTI